MGEAVLRDVAEKRGLDITVDSCGTAGYHEGEDPDDRYVDDPLQARVDSDVHWTRTVSTCKKVGMDLC